MSYSSIQTIRYMGNKSKLLDFIVPEIELLTEEGDMVCDLMAGTNAISYALKTRNRVLSNDIQNYSYVISKCLMQNKLLPSEEEIHKDIDINYFHNRMTLDYRFFVDNYTDTYFSGEQCLEIDSLRFAIDKVEDEDKKAYYLTLLMNAMCKAQSTTGHFAQYLNKEHKRCQELRAKSIYVLFYEKIKEFSDFKISKYNHIQTNLDYKELFKDSIISEVKCFYLDSPYTTDQYSRFYHLLETVCLYDYPTLEHKAKYRNDRQMSDFCYKKSVANEFENIVSFCCSIGSSLVISYSNHGVISIDELKTICEKYYNVKMKTISFEHSSQGKGTIGIQEVLFILI